ncbi:MAG: hypothetical protein KDD22_06665, partial [Bdellovibrionales bacterium]|nr:hypothetical protein [Bdellovibrionales bacterium]
MKRRIQDEFKSGSCGALVSLSRDLRVPFFVATTFVLLFHSTVTWAARGVIERIGDATHVEFQGQADWNYNVNRVDKTHISVIVPAFDESTEARLKSWSGDLVSKVQVNKTASDGRFELIFQLADADVESFDYLTDQPSRLIVDFYRQINQSSEALEIPAPAPKAKAKKKIVKKEEPIKPGEYQNLRSKDIERDPAGSEILEVLSSDDQEEAPAPFPMKGVFDGGDPNFDRFRMKDYQISESSIIANRNNV